MALRDASSSPPAAVGDPSALRASSSAGRVGHEVPVRVSARTDYALRAAAELAAIDGRMLKAEQIARAQGIPQKFLLNIMTLLRQEGIVRSLRGADGGYRLARGADEITLADVISAVEGPLSTVRDGLPGERSYEGPAEGLRRVWLILQDRVHGTLDGITLADLVSGTVPEA